MENKGGLVARLLKFEFLWIALLVFGAAVLKSEEVMKPNEQAKPLMMADTTVYLLTSNDEISIRSLHVKEIADKPFRIDQTGDVNFPLLGRLRLAGLTIHEAEALLAEKAKVYYVDPDIAVNVSTFHEQPVSVIGAVGNPGIHQIHSGTTLLDVLSSAGGVRVDAGPVVKITRQKRNGNIPHTSARETDTDTSVAEINLKSLMDAAHPEENILIQKNDKISIPPAEVVYVVGNVKRAGGFPLGGKPNLSVLQALSLAEGTDYRAAPKNARIIRRGPGQEQRTEIAVDLTKVLAGKSEDLVLHPNDILFVPSSAAKAISARTIEAAIQLGTQILIFH